MSIHIVYHAYLTTSTALTGVIRDLVEKGTNLIPKPHTDYIICKEGEKIVAKDRKRDPEPDAVLFFDKDILLARLLEERYPVFNSSHAIAASDDKIETWRLLAPRLPMVPTIPAPFHYFSSMPEDSYLDAVEALGYPVVVKAAKGSFGEQVFLAEDRAALEERILAMGEAPFLFQPFDLDAAGKDIRVLIVGDTIIGAIKRTNDRDFRANIAAGGRAEPYILNERQRAIALAAHRALGLTFSGIDLTASCERPALIEVNSNMSYMGFQQATGIDVSRKILDHIATLL
ncbi:ribosomal protein S6--L-glutamate ligase [Peptoniphilus ivorii]|uniref:ATP-grasp domain-containing protein n=1 Tax=Aedoeadaptatus ivorii TaxID=54006 RepID=UPI0027824E4B|nr:RimK family alpha-L-glutamate ligase [Peptoniphilus ivorii]MDQ0508002.1 ribosomal protein S6--L-glutamate ligase [Peptoniphilus ivorii]